MDPVLCDIVYQYSIIYFPLLVLLHDNFNVNKFQFSFQRFNDFFKLGN